MRKSQLVARSDCSINETLDQRVVESSDYVILSSTHPCIFLYSAKGCSSAGKVHFVALLAEQTETKHVNRIVRQRLIPEVIHFLVLIGKVLGCPYTHAIDIQGSVESHRVMVICFVYEKAKWISNIAGIATQVLIQIIPASVPN